MRLFTFKFNSRVLVHIDTSNTSVGGLPLIMYAPRERGRSSFLYISIPYNMQKKRGAGGSMDSM